MLGSAQSTAGEASTWASGTTENGEPQFYLLGPAPGEECVLCISRVRGTYLLEDGSGALLAEDRQLKPILHKAAAALTRRKRVGIVLRALFAFCAVRTVLEQKLEPFMAETTEHLTRVVPQLAALV
jgi:hypothetical protein